MLFLSYPNTKSTPIINMLYEIKIQFDAYSCKNVKCEQVKFILHSYCKFYIAGFKYQ